MAVFEQITVLGPGLLGASLLMAVKQRNLCNSTRAWARRPETRRRCLESGLCDSVDEDPAEAVRGSDLVIACTPVAHIPDLLRSIAANIQADALVTDVGSTKAAICADATHLFPGGAVFVGSHPMAGSEKSGLEHADPRLFEGRPCFVTPTTTTPATAVTAVSRFWTQLGMQVTVTSPSEHDAITAHISHLPHLVASTLAAFLAGKDPNWACHAGNGLRDTTRIAAGDPLLWQQIFSSNRAEVLAALDGLVDQLASWRRELADGDFEALRSRLETGKTFRDSLP